MIRSSKCLTQLKSIFGMKMIKCRRRRRKREKRKIEKLIDLFFYSHYKYDKERIRIVNRKVHMLPTTNYQSINSLSPWRKLTNYTIFYRLKYTYSASYLCTNQRKQSCIFFFRSIITFDDNFFDNNSNLYTSEI